MKKIILAASGIIHPPFRAIRHLGKALEQSGNFFLSRIPSLEELPIDIDTFDAIVLYFHQKKLSKSALDRLTEFISTGGGMLGVHSATASFKQNDRYFELIGGRFIYHGKVERITIQATETSTIFPQSGPIIINDELYFHDLKEDIEIHYTTDIKSGNIPVVWTRQEGKGRVCYAMPGHTANSIRHPGIHKILLKAMDWVTRK